MTPRRKIAPPSPAAQALAAHGSTQAQLAEMLNVTPMAVSHYLRGTRGAPIEPMRVALTDLLDCEAAGEILALIPSKAKQAAAV